SRDDSVICGLSLSMKISNGGKRASDQAGVFRALFCLQSGIEIHANGANFKRFRDIVRANAASQQSGIQNLGRYRGPVEAGAGAAVAGVYDNAVDGLFLSQSLGKIRPNFLDRKSGVEGAR